MAASKQRNWPDASSRTSRAAAGWDCERPGEFRSRMPAGPVPTFSWLRPKTLWQSRNDKIAHWFFDPSDLERRRWIKAQRARGLDPETPIGAWRSEEDLSFLVVGDPGEGDESQYACVPAIEQLASETEFMLICSDVIYPTGDVNDYPTKFFRPYGGYKRPIYAVPGNHDWYDGLAGFMRVFCDAPPLDRESGGMRKGLLRRLLWRQAPELDPPAFAAGRAWRANEAQQQPERQRGPYWTIETGPVRIVGIDTGITGGLDAEQGAWLRHVSKDPSRPKILITGKPLYVDGVPHSGQIAGTDETVDDIVRDSDHNYIAAIGGDIHNYQRYPVRVPGGRIIEYVVAGGGGAFMHATHKIPPVNLPGVVEADFRCYPLRGDSLALYSRLWDRRLFGGNGLVEIDPDAGASYMKERIGVDPTRGGAPIDKRTRWAAEAIYPLGAQRSFHRLFSEFFDWNDPPLFKSFLRIDASRAHVTISCLAGTGCGEDEAAAPLEDQARIELKDGRPVAWHHLGEPRA